MKRLVSLLLVAVMLVCIGSFSVNAENLYRDRFIEKIGRPINYIEEYAHYTENNEVDWIFIYACTQMAIVDPLPGASAGPTYRNCGLLFGVKDLYKPFNIGYCVYDVAKDEFLDITTLNIDEYDGLRDFVVENELAYVIGDLDYDNKITIQDATWIQKIEAKCYVEGCLISKLSSRAHDFNNDGAANVMDATAIQMKLAQVSE